MDVLQANPQKMSQVNALLTAHGINLTDISSHVNQAVPTPVTNARQDVVHNVKKQMTVVQQTLQNMRNALQQASQQVEGNTKTRTLNFTTFIDQQLNKLINNVQAQGAKQIYKAFIKFAYRFHRYSFQNQMLIWIQNKDAVHVAGAGDWLKKFGRQVVDYSKPITILAPIPYTKQNQKGQKQRKMGFGAVKVYDITATKPLANKPSSEVFEPVSHDYTKDQETDQHIQKLIKSIHDLAAQNQIQIKDVQLATNHGGSSTGGGIEMNSKVKGIQRLSTLIHQMAHQVLHWMLIQTGKSRKNAQQVTIDPMQNSKQRQIDAQSTAAIVLAHFGYEAPKASAYLTLWGAKGADIRKRRQSISKAAHFIINGMLKNIGKISKQEQSQHDLQQTMESAPPAPIIASSNWYHSYKYAKKKHKKKVKQMDSDDLSQAQKAQNEQFGIKVY